MILIGACMLCQMHTICVLCLLLKIYFEPALREESFITNKAKTWNTKDQHSLKSVRIRSYSGPHSPAFSPNAGECGRE